MVLLTDVAHEHADLAVVNLSPVATPLPFYAHRVRTAFRETAGIESDDAIGLAQSIGHLTNQHLEQRLMIPWCGTDEVLNDLSLNIDPRRDVLGILALQMGQQPLEGEMHRVLVGFGLQRLLIGHNELAQTIHHLIEDVGGNDTIAQHFFSPLCPRSRDYGSGNVYEMRIYTYDTGQIPKVLEAWAKAIPDREKFSPLAACWYSELGGLNKFVHTWVYKDLNERARVREEARTSGGAWPPQAGVRPIRQENKLLVPAAFSPVR
jgi:hypothetical protein